jgi:UDP-GlcNAc:undecaprenyl-phosphate GlcNAc-1-phosphate transferase
VSVAGAGPAILTAFGIGLVCSLLLTPAMRSLAWRRGWLDPPDGLRKLHTVPVPTLGGVIVYLAFLLALAALLAVLPEAATSAPGGSAAYLHLALACAAVMLIGVADDMRGVSPAAKVLVQAGAGGYLYLQGFRIAVVSNPFGMPISVGALALPLTILWFVGMSNAFNLIDGLDGLAAGIASLATASLLVAALFNDRLATAAVAAALVGALLGFLRYNFAPASIFLGDSGSLFVGFALAGLAIHGFMKRSAAIAVAAPLLVLALPILDVAVAVARRLIRGRGVFAADRDHIHHRLLRLGLTPRGAVVSLYGVATLFALGSLIAMRGTRQVLWAVLLLAVLGVWTGMRQLGYVEFSELQRTLARHLLPRRRELSNNMRLRELRDELARADTLGDLWKALVAGAEEIGFVRLEVALLPAYAARLSSSSVSSPSQFPLWTRDGSMAEDSESWAWTIGLRHGSHALGQVIITRRLGDRGLDFDAAYFVEALATDFTAGLDRALGMDTKDGGLVPAPIESTT